MNERSLRVLEWPKIKAQVAERASFSLGKELVENLTPAVDIDEVRERLAMTSEALALIWKHGEPPMGGASDIRAVVTRAALGGTLDESQLLAVLGLLYCTGRLSKYMQAAGPKLFELSAGLTPLSRLSDEIVRCIDEDGTVRDHATPELARIRQKQRTIVNRLRDRLESLIHSASAQKMLQNPSLPLEADAMWFRYAVNTAASSGIVHDQSASGATVFMEPALLWS